MACQIKATGVRRFSIVTEALPPAFARRMSEEILSRNLQVSWNSFAMVDQHFEPSTLESMRRAGCEYLVVGAEAMTDRVLRLVEKSATSAENAAFFRACRDAGIRLRVNLIPDLPTTTRAEALDSLEAFRALRDCFESVAIFPFEATRSSRVGRDPDRYGLFVTEEGSNKGQAQYQSNHLDRQDAAMTVTERIEIHARFRAFAEEVAHSTSRYPSASYADLLRNARVRLPVEELVLLLDDGSACCYDRSSGHLHSFSPAVTPLLEVLADGLIRPWHDVASRLDDALGADIVARFLGASRLLRVGDKG
jgi:hypothetical protein